ncbi:MAG TPA: FAD/NAD(P)-binding oxidoreductase [Bacteroidales bacterium]|nr:FAD/NAD(P)-binding oxidoreductase [Bacteroidales bacterium]
MKKIMILGAGTAGTIMANKLRKALDRREWEITIIDKNQEHYYQPGFLFLPFGVYNESHVVKAKLTYLPKGVNVIYNEADKVIPEDKQVRMADGTILHYDYLIIATGAQVRPDQTPGLLGQLWYKTIFDFYTVEGAVKLGEFLKTWEGGHLVISIAELPYKCPVAPLEFAFLADAYFTKSGIRNKVKISYVTPLAGAFTKPIATKMLSDLLKEKNIEVISDFYLERVDNESKCIVSYDGREVSFDLLTIIPVNMGDELIARSGLGDDLNFVPTDKHTLRSEKHENVFVLGDASNIPTSKAGSVAHFSADILFENLMASIAGKPLNAKFDGHANCFIETGFGKGSLIDFNYDTEPLPGTFPLPFFGPFGLLRNNRINHWGKMMFRWLYWNLIITGVKIPMMGSHMTMTGKRKTG